MEFRTSLLGYSKVEVDQKLSELNKALATLYKERDRDQDIIREMKFQLSQERDRSPHIQQAMIDARELSSRIIADAEAEAYEIRTQAERDASAAVAHFESYVKQLEDMEKVIRTKEKHLKIEFRKLIDNYVKAVEDVDLAPFYQVRQDIDSYRMDMEDMARNSKTVIDIAPALSNSGAARNRQEEPPTYSFNRE